MGSVYDVAVKSGSGFQGGPPTCQMRGWWKRESWKESVGHDGRSAGSDAVQSAGRVSGVGRQRP